MHQDEFIDHVIGLYYKDKSVTLDRLGASGDRPEEYLRINEFLESEKTRLSMFLKNNFDISQINTGSSLQILRFIRESRLNYISNFIKFASVIDWARPGLAVDVWDENSQLFPHIKEQIFEIAHKHLKDNGFIHADKWLKKGRIVGSLTSYRYSDITDLDAHFIVDLDEVNKYEFDGEKKIEEIDDMFKLISKDLRYQNYEILGTKHQLEIYFETGLRKGSVLDGEYDFFAGKWAIEPRTITYDFSFDTFYPELYKEVEDIMAKLDIEINHTYHEIVHVEDLMIVLADWLRRDPSKAKFFQDELDKRMKEIEFEIRGYVTKVKKIHETREVEIARKDEMGSSAVAFKYLQRFNYIYLYKKMKEYLEKGITPENLKEVGDILKSH